jgi:hypothetical protein
MKRLRPLVARNPSAFVEQGKPMKHTLKAIALFAVVVPFAACVQQGGQAPKSSAPAPADPAPAPEASTAAPAGQPSVGSSTDLTAFKGARAGQAEMGIQSLGYEQIRSKGLTSYWFNRETGACAAITTAQGRYSDVQMLPAEDC